MTAVQLGFDLTTPHDGTADRSVREILRAVAPPREEEPLPLLLMRNDTSPKWRGPGVWGFTRYQHSVDRVLSGPTLVQGGNFAWFPTVADARAHAERHHEGPRSKKLGPRFDVEEDGPGLFGWELARAWALAVAGYDVHGWGNGCAVLVLDPERYFDGASFAEHRDDVFKFTYEVREEELDEMLRARGLDPMGPADQDPDRKATA